MVETQVKTKLPEPDRGMTVFYATEDNQLVRNDPKQQTLNLRVVEYRPAARQGTQGGGVNGTRSYDNQPDPQGIGDMQAAIAAGAALGDPRSPRRGTRRRASSPSSPKDYRVE